MIGWNSNLGDAMIKSGNEFYCYACGCKMESINGNFICPSCGSTYGKDTNRIKSSSKAGIANTDNTTTPDANTNDNLPF